MLVDPNRTELPAIGTLVVVMDPHASAVKMIKRLASRGARRFAVSSDNPMEARDSRQLGSLDPEQLVGAATLVFKRSGRLCLPGEHGSRR